MDVWDYIFILLISVATLIVIGISIFPFLRQIL